MASSAQDKVIVTGFSGDGFNGTYYYAGDANGYPMYRKDSSTYIVYHAEYGPLSFSGSYYLIKEYRIPGSIKIEKAKFRLEGVNPSSSSWQAVMNTISGEDHTGVTIFDDASSSSESSSSESVLNFSSSSSKSQSSVSSSLSTQSYSSYSSS